MAYALDDNGSLQKTGSASFFGSSVSDIWELRSGRPTNQTLGNRSLPLHDPSELRIAPFRSLPLHIPYTDSTDPNASLTRQTLHTARRHKGLAFAPGIATALATAAVIGSSCLNAEGVDEVRPGHTQVTTEPKVGLQAPQNR